MTLPKLLTELARLGIQLKADGEHLRYAPRAALTSDLAEQLKANKPALLAYLETGEIVLNAQTVTVADVQLALDLFKPSRIANSDAVLSQSQDTESER